MTTQKDAKRILEILSGGMKSPSIQDLCEIASVAGNLARRFLELEKRLGRYPDDEDLFVWDEGSCSYIEFETTFE